MAKRRKAGSKTVRTLGSISIIVGVGIVAAYYISDIFKHDAKITGPLAGG